MTPTLTQKFNLTAEQIRSIIDDFNYQLFYVEFFKKDGTLRKMMCYQIEPPSGNLSETGLQYDPDDFNLILVIDIVSKGTRSISLDRITRISSKTVNWE